jgi:streptogrisin D
LSSSRSIRRDPKGALSTGRPSRVTPRRPYLSRAVAPATLIAALAAVASPVAAHAQTAGNGTPAGWGIAAAGVADLRLQAAPGDTPTPLAAPAGSSGLTVPRSTPKASTVDPAVRPLAKQSGLSLRQAAARLAAQRQGQKVADRLTKQLGSKTGGAYFDAAGRLVVTVTDRAAASTVTRAGVAVRVVKYGSARLDAVKAAVDREATAVGAVTAIDVRANKVTVSVPISVPAARTRSVLSKARGLGDAVTVTRIRQKVSTLSWIAGGTPIYHSSGARCSAGFNVQKNGYRYVLTAGHCTALGNYWYNWNGPYLGNVAGSYFPGRDFGAIYNGGGITQLPGVYLYNGYYQPTYAAANTYVGQYVCKSGSTTGVTCGYITAKNVTVNYAEGTVYGLDQASLCADHGDSGGALFAGTTGYGTVSGGIGGTCTTFYQPLVQVLNYWGLSLI